jgi:cell division protein FtsL
VGSIVLGLVSLNALLAQTSFRIDDVSDRIDSLSQEFLRLTREQAELSAPGRIAAWASRHGMRLPDDIHLLHVPTSASAAPAGVPDSLDPRALAAKALAEGRG